MTTQPIEGSGDTLPVEQIAGHDVGSWVTFEASSHRTISGYLVGLEVRRALINDTALCEATTRFVEVNNYEVEVHAQGTFLLREGNLVHVEAADPSLGVVLGRVHDALRAEYAARPTVPAVDLP